MFLMAGFDHIVTFTPELSTTNNFSHLVHVNELHSPVAFGTVQEALPKWKPGIVVPLTFFGQVIMGGWMSSNDFQN